MKTLLSVAALLSLALPVLAATQIVAVNGLQFVPDEITIDQGDTVEWVHDATSLFHTITNGTGPGDAEVGSLFDQTFSSSGQTFAFTFSAAGDVPYFCRPHLGVGMTGLIHVQESLPAETSAWGRVKRLYNESTGW